MCVVDVSEIYAVSIFKVRIMVNAECTSRTFGTLPPNRTFKDPSVE
jgi:hypothetical protein